MILSEIWTAASIELGIRADAAGEKQTMVTRLANNGVLEILKRTKIRVTSAQVFTTANVDDYDLPMEVLRLTGLDGPVPGGTGFSPLDRTSPDDIRYRRRSPSSSSQSTTGRFALDGFNLLMIYPMPTTVYGMVMYYVPRPTKMAAGADDPATIAFGGIPEEFHETVLLPFIYWRAGSALEDLSSAQGARYKQEFDDGLKDLRVRINRRARLGPATTAWNRRRRPVYRNDQA